MSSRSKTRVTFLLACVLLGGALPAVPGQEASARGIESLSAAEQEQVSRLLASATEHLQGFRIIEAMEELDKAEAIAGGFHAIHNLRGAAYVKIKKLDEARESFRRALQLNPGVYEPRFNLVELDFVEGKFEAALDGFAGILQDYPRLPEIARHMILYKLVICNLKLGKRDAAVKSMEGLTYLDDTPAYYYSLAALAYADGDEAGALEHVASAVRIFDENDNAIYQDSLKEMGWMSTFNMTNPDLAKP
jgi:tetratricopeptide (TPR) repeat protein